MRSIKSVTFVCVFYDLAVRTIFSTKINNHSKKIKDTKILNLDTKRNLTTPIAIKNQSS